MKRRFLTVIICIVMALTSAVPVCAQAQSAPVIANLTVSMTGYWYRGSNDKDGRAAVTFDEVARRSGIDREDLPGDLEVTGISQPSVLSESGIDWTEDEIVLMPDRAGTVTVFFTLDEREFAVKLTVYQPVMSSALMLYPKQTSTLTVTGAPAGTRPVYATSNAKVATVNAAGKVTAKAQGNAVIYASVGTVKLGCVVAVTSKKKTRAVNRAVRMASTSRYSQRKRMKKGYYDCSSLVWRAYKPEKYRFGNKKYAPTAALEAKYLAKKKKILGSISYQQIQSMRYRAGDLFFLTGANNRRYKGIYHVEMFRGYRYMGMTQTGVPVVTSLWANRADGRYDMGVAGIMGRP